MIHVAGSAFTWLRKHDVPEYVARSAEWSLDEDGTTKVAISGVVTYVLTQTYRDEGVSGFNVDVQNALV